MEMPHIKPDLIVMHPCNVDFPLWRHFVRTNRALFDQVIVAFTQRNVSGPNICNFLKKEMEQDNAIFVHTPIRVHWDHESITAGIALSKSEYFLLMHEDFLIRNDQFLPAVLNCTEDLIGVIQEMGIETGIDLQKLIEAGRRAEEILGQRLRSNIIRSGPVIHGESAPDKEAGAKAAAN